MADVRKHARGDPEAKAIEMEHAIRKSKWNRRDAELDFLSESFAIRSGRDNLMQAIARVNRVYGDKPAGLVVDYLGIASDLRQALSFSADAGDKGDPMLAHQHSYVEDCEVCCNPLQISYTVKDNALGEFETKRLE